MELEKNIQRCSLIKQNYYLKFLFYIVFKLGLEPEYWLRILRDELHISSVQALKHVSEDELLVLAARKRHNWEGEALKKLNKDKNKLKDAFSMNFCQMFSLLCSSPASQQDLLEDPFLESSGRFGGSTPSKESKSAAKHLKDTGLKIFENESISCVEGTYPRLSTMTDAQVFAGATQGHALMGINLSMVPTQNFPTTQCLLKAPEIEFCSPSIDKECSSEWFESADEHTHTEKLIDGVRRNLNISAGIGFPSFGVHAGAEGHRLKAREETHPNQAEHSTAACLLHNITPMASCSISQDKVFLSEAALEALKTIEDSMSDDHSRPVEDFFKKFGTHANLGPFYLGGNFRCIASADVCSEDELSEVKDWAAKGLKAFASGKNCEPFFDSTGGFNAAVSHPKGRMAKAQRRQTEKKLNLKISMFGGPNVDDYQQWKVGLQNKATWEIIFYSTNYYPVWDIIRKNHQQCFKNYSKMATMLEDEFCNLTHQESRRDSSEELMRQDLSQVPNWRVSEAEKLLERLCNRPQIEDFIRSFFADKNFQEFLVEVARSDFKAETLSKIKFYIRYLLEKADKAEFPQKEQLSVWSRPDFYVSENEIATIPDFVHLLKEARKELLSPEAGSSPIFLLFLQ